ncbi:MAG: hypothetical protein NVS3B20_15180 [Polyangiales bacterium]
MLELVAMHSSDRDLQKPANLPRRVRLAHLDQFPSRSHIATHEALFPEASERRCDVCDTVIVGADDGGSGLFIWTRGDEVRYEEPPLCPQCGPSLALAAMRRWEEEDEEEG